MIGVAGHNALVFEAGGVGCVAGDGFGKKKASARISPNADARRFIMPYKGVRGLSCWDRSMTRRKF